ncbi:hypothetical protein MTO96_006522 [Rhipicephalus appendiculatus]
MERDAGHKRNAMRVRMNEEGVAGGDQDSRLKLPEVVHQRNSLDALYLASDIRASGREVEAEEILGRRLQRPSHSCCAKASSSKLSFPVAQLKDDRL